MTAKDTLLRAAELLERDGWCRGNSIDRQGRRCAMGAINSASHEPGSGTAWDRFDQAADRLQTYLGRTHVPDWNDHPERTAEQVIAALREAANN